jgi:sulfoacetaldehyde acetyltransferase
LVERVADVGEALRAACNTQRDGKTTIVEMMCTRELGDPFRRDALKKPTRLLEKYKRYA